MTDAAFKATFEDFRIVKGRKVCQLVLEVPLEGADAALKALGGLPRPDDPMWVGVARMGRKEPTEKPKRSWDEMSLAEQAGIRCSDANFQNWLLGICGNPGHPMGKLEEWTVERVRLLCDVQSRSDILVGTEAGRKWMAIDEEYRQSQGLLAERTT